MGCAKITLEVRDDNNRVIATYNAPYGAVLRIEDGQMVAKGETLFDWDPYTSVILADRDGKIEYEDIIENMTFREELDEQTGLKQRVVVESKNKNLNPHIYVVDEKSGDRSKFIIHNSMPLEFFSCSPGVVALRSRRGTGERTAPS